MRVQTLKARVESVAELNRNSSSYGLAFGIVGLVFWILAVRSANFLNMGQLGLVSVLGWMYFAGLVLVATGFVSELLRTTLRPVRLTFLLALFVVVIYGTASAVEPVAAITDSWIHAGFVQYIIQHGHPLNGYDARFSWPGGFSLAAVLASWVGKSNVYCFFAGSPLSSNSPIWRRSSLSRKILASVEERAGLELPSTMRPTGSSKITFRLKLSTTFSFSS